MNTNQEICSRIAKFYDDPASALVLLTRVTAKWSTESLVLFERAERSLSATRIKNQIPRTTALLSIGLAGAPQIKARDPEEEGKQYRAKPRW